MRGGLSAILQTLTPEASTVLTHSITEAARRSHGQTTPLHVASTLLSAPNGLLRQACIRSHPNSSHPLQCRALELCFSVAMDRLPTTSAASPPSEPPLSNALTAALKRAQAHQRRGCPEQQQQPLLAVKVELEQLIISILDDPSVSRVMKEASFSSPAVKLAIEQAITSQPSTRPGPQLGLGFRPGVGVGVGLGVAGRSLYLNPRLQQQQQLGSNVNVNANTNLDLNANVMQSRQGREEDVKRVLDILGKPSKSNPVLVGEFVVQDVVKEVLVRLEKIHDGLLKDVQVVSMEKEFGLDTSQFLVKVKELGGLIEKKMLASSNGVIVDLGDLKWLIDHPVNNVGVSELARQAVVELGKIMRKFGEGRRFWFIGTATCETYLRCQVYHPTMESEWDVQVVSIVAKPPVSGLFPRMGSNGGIISSSVECLTATKSFPMAGLPLLRQLSEKTDPLTRLSCCPHCTEKYNQELHKLTADKSSLDFTSDTTQQTLPFWLQNARLNNNNNNDPAQNKDEVSILRSQKEELQKKWNDTCSELHPNFHQGFSTERITPSPLSMRGFHNPSLLGQRPSQPKLQQPESLGEALKLKISPPLTDKPNSNRPLGSPVRTDLMLGLTKSLDKVNGFASDNDSFKKLVKGLMEVVWWQTEASSAIASAITRTKSGNGKLRGGGSKGDIWLLFSGPDRVGKTKMAAALSELLCGAPPILISLGSRRDGDESDLNFRGKTGIDKIGEAIRRNPFSVIMLKDIDEANVLIRGSIQRAMERGRLVDSHGREISLGNVIFILTLSGMPSQLQPAFLRSGLRLSEEKLTSLAGGGWQLKISVVQKNIGKRPPTWLAHHVDDDDNDQGRATKQRKEMMGLGLSLDLNRVADAGDDHNLSDLTMDQEEEGDHQNRRFHELLASADEAIVFKPVDFTRIRQNIERSITAKFVTILGDKFSISIENEALDKIMSGIWLGQSPVESWVDKVLVPAFHQLKFTLPSVGSPEGEMVVLLELDIESGSRDFGDWLPGKVSVVTGQG